MKRLIGAMGTLIAFGLAVAGVLGVALIVKMFVSALVG